MKLHFQRINLFVYVYFLESKGLKVISTFEDFDETATRFNAWGKRLELDYDRISEAQTSLENDDQTIVDNSRVKYCDFYDEFFDEKN